MGSSGGGFSRCLPLLRPPLPRGLPTHKVMTNLDAERIDISAFAVGLVEPLCTHAGGTAPPPDLPLTKAYPQIKLEVV